MSQTGVLALDVSNLLTSAAFLADGGRPVRWSISSAVGRTVDEYRVLLARLLVGSGIDARQVRGSVMACVVPELCGTIARAVESVSGKAPLVVGPGVRTGLDIRTDEPRQVGADRIANAVAARDLVGAPAIVADFGTAFTLDVVGPDGDYVGAVIAPGIDVTAHALTRRAARLGQIAVETPPRAIADNTAHGLQSGLVFGYIGLVDGLIDRVRSEVGPAPVVATGDGPWIRELLAGCRSIDHYEQLLALTGLRLIHDRHHGRPSADRAPRPPR